MNGIPFIKMHGCANDFVLFRRDQLSEPERGMLDSAADPVWIQSICDRRTGVGADGVLILDRDQSGWSAKVLNADGRDGGMCGNGLRCIARNLMESGDSRAAEPLTIRMAGRDTVLHIESGSPFRCTLDLGTVTVGRAAEETQPEATTLPALSAGIQGETISLAWAGNPHAIVFAPSSAATTDLPEAARAIRSSGWFQNGANVTVARVLSPDRIQAHTDERGVGPTMACASGAIATAAAAHANGFVDLACTVRMPGGELCVSLRPTGSDWNYQATITAGAETVFQGSIPLPARGPGA